MYETIDIVVIEFTIQPVPMTLEQALCALAQEAKNPGPTTVEFFDIFVEREAWKARSCCG